MSFLEVVREAKQLRMSEQLQLVEELLLVTAITPFLPALDRAATSNCAHGLHSTS